MEGDVSRKIQDCPDVAGDWNECDGMSEGRHYEISQSQRQSRKVWQSTNGKAPVLGIALLLVLTVIPALSYTAIAPGFGMDSDLKDSHASFLGEFSNDFAGYSVTGAGDVNGDGLDDILIGAYGNNEGGAISGQTYLILGKPAGWATDIPLFNADASFVGEQGGDCSGFSVAGAGDVNGDGYDDILIGAHGSDLVVADRGQTYLIFGKPTGWTMDTPLSNSNASFWGENIFDYSGWSVAGAGDVNGDGYDDILIGAYKNDELGVESGQTYLIFGKLSGWAMDTSLANANASFLGEIEYLWSGHSVAGAGDVNGDGYDDILIGAHRDGFIDGVGRTYLILGNSSGWTMDTPLSNADASFVGEQGGDEAGWSVAGAGDVNGDGYDDILIGATGSDDGGPESGQTYLILGNSSGWALSTSISNADASFLGEDAGDWSGISVAGAGDVNEDGYGDILIGAFLDEEGGLDAGQTYLIMGNSSGWEMDASLNNVDASFWGEDTWDKSGFSVACSGDVNGDGSDDILIGAWGNDERGGNAGETYLILGLARPLPDYIPWNVVPFSTQYVLPGSLNQIAARVMNTGLGNASSSSIVAFYNETDRNDTFQVYAVSALNSAEVSSEFQAVWKAPVSLTNVFNVTVEVDFSHNIQESNETNNTYTIQFVVVQPPLPPTNLTTRTVDNVNIILKWEQPESLLLDHYLIYRITDQREFDFSTPVYNTSADTDPLRTNWTDIDAATVSAPRELYYVVRAVNGLENMSITSNTAGKWTKDFSSGLNTFSVPLESFEIRNISWYASDIQTTTFIRWMSSTGHWITHFNGMGEGINDNPIEMGRGYEIFLTSQTYYTFCGFPASMIRFQEGLGDSVTFRKGLSALIQGNDVNLSWNAPAGTDRYLVFRSDERDGLHDLSLSPIANTTETYWRDTGIIGNQKSEYYYLVIPLDSASGMGSSTYSVGVFTMNYQTGSDTFALPLKPSGPNSLDWYCDNIPYVVGMAYMVFEMWKFHAGEMPSGVYDPVVQGSEGYQISMSDIVSGTFTFVGW
jgi:hypothetical protein